MIIEKVARQGAHRYRHVDPFPRARDGFRAWLTANGTATSRVLLPAYIGWSPREGSGVFDPISELGLGFGFYGVDAGLDIDRENVLSLIDSGGFDVLVLIHYFGRVDPMFGEVARYAREKGVLVVEDAAHALFAHYVRPMDRRVTGRPAADAVLFSLHKMLPTPTGGIILHDSETGITADSAPSADLLSLLWKFNLSGISERRRQNAAHLAEMLPQLSDHVTPLWSEIGDHDVPQTYPVLVNNVSRDAVYEMMNARGFGVVSLYHTLISEIAGADFPVSHWLSRRILNLPVHQDAELHNLERMLDVLHDVCIQLENEQS